MEDEIDLRAIVRGLLRNWPVMLGLAVAGLLVGLALGFLRSPTYQAAALVLVAESPYSLRLEDVNQSAPVSNQDYQDLVTSDDVMAGVLQQAGNVLPANERSVADLRLKLTVEPSSAPRFLKLKAADSNPDNAAQLANLWAKVLVEQTAQLYGPGTSQLMNYQDQLDASRQRLAQSEQALAEFQSQNLVSILQAQLVSRQFSLSDNLSQHYRLQFLAGGAQDLLTRLEKQDGSAPASRVDEAAMVLLVTQASETGLQVTNYSVGQGITTTTSFQQSSAPPVQIQFSLDTPSGQTVSQLRESVTAFVSTLTARSAETQTAADSQRPAILDLQGQLAQAQAKQDELDREHALADDEYRELAAKLNQVKIAAQDQSLTVRVASNASVPNKPAGAGRAVLAAIGGALGLLLGMFVLLIAQWWHAPEAAEAVTSDRKIERPQA